MCLVCLPTSCVQHPNILIITLLLNNHCPRTASGVNTNLKSISASGHHLPSKSLKQFGRALSTQAAAVAKKTTTNNNNNDETNNHNNNNSNDNRAGSWLMARCCLSGPRKLERRVLAPACRERTLLSLLLL